MQNFKNLARSARFLRIPPQLVGKMQILMLYAQFYGPRIGALYAKQPGHVTPVHPMLFGGGQERNFRPGRVHVWEGTGALYILS